MSLLTITSLRGQSEPWSESGVATEDDLADRPSSENLIHLIPHVLAARRLQIPHCRFHVGVTKPLLNGAQINASPEAPRGERGAELMQPEAIRVELRTLGNSLEEVEL